jgi:hypothetical protein
MRRVKSVALIGNGTIDEPLWFDVNRHDLVIRFNACKHFGKITGRRADIVVFVNTGRSGQKLALEADSVDLGAVAAAKEFWFSAASDVIVDQIASNPTTADAPTHKDHPGDWVDFSEDLKRMRCNSKPNSFIEGEYFFGAQALLKDHGAKPGTRPSTGFLTLYKVRQTWKPERISLFGFQHKGWPGHPWDAEKSAIAAMQDVSYWSVGSKANAFFAGASSRFHAAMIAPLTRR